MRDTFCPWYRVKEYKVALKPIVFYKHALQYYHERITMNTIAWFFTYYILQICKISVDTLYAEVIKYRQFLIQIFWCIICFEPPEMIETLWLVVGLMTSHYKHNGISFFPLIGS